MSEHKDKSIARSLGEFFGHIARGIKTDPAKTKHTKELKREVVEEEQDSMVLRRTTIEEIEFRDPPEDKKQP